MHNKVTGSRALCRIRMAYMYSELLLDHFQNPRNVGELPAPAIAVEVSNPACGDILRLSARFAGERVVEARYKVRGCTASIAAGSALTEWLLGKQRDELAAFQPAVIETALGGLQAESKHAAVLCGDGVKRLRAAAGWVDDSDTTATRPLGNRPLG